MDSPFFQPIEPSHSYWPQAWRKNFTHQSLVFRIYSHALVIMTIPQDPFCHHKQWKLALWISVVNQFSQYLLRRGTKISDTKPYPWHYLRKPVALWGLENKGLTNTEELVLYASPYLALPFYSYGEVERLSSPCVETALTLHGEGMISYPTSCFYRPTHVHLLGSDWVSGLVLSNDEALSLQLSNSLSFSAFLCSNDTCSFNLYISPSLLW